MLQIFLIAVSLALDAFAVAVSSGISAPGSGRRQAIKLGCWFGGFQFAMPLVGWLLGSSFSQYIRAVDYWVAFGLLAFIGGKMVYGALKKGCTAAPCGCSTALPARRLAVLALATSIDALAVGVSMAFMDVNILVVAAVTGAVAFLLSVVGGLAGCRLGCLFQKRAELVGGLVLIGIGVKILAEHLGG